VVSVNTRYSTAEVAKLLKRAGAKALITDQSTEPSMHSVQPVQTIQVADLLRATSDSTNIVGRSQPIAHQSEVDLAGEHCVIFTTSGSTGEPKMVVHRQAAIASHSIDIASCGFDSEDIALVAMPLCGTFGLSSLLGAVASGCSKVVVPDRFDAANVASLISEHRVSLINGSDDMFHRLLATGSDLSSVRVGGYARFNTSLDGIVERAAERGMHLTGLYGMSEVQALFTIRDVNADSITRSQAGGSLTSQLAYYRIVDGELQLKGPSLFEGYLAEGGARIDQTLTEATMEGEWFKTGDSAEQSGADDDRSFTFLSRLGDVLRIGGFLVAPTEIEQVLVGFGRGEGGGQVLGEIVAAQVVAADRPTGARPVAFVLLTDGSKELDETAVKAHCSAELAKFKVPIRIFTLDAFPMVDGPNGLKIRRDELRRLAEQFLSEQTRD
jgi:fatty-acyl-CoA synthase